MSIRDLRSGFTRLGQVWRPAAPARAPHEETEAKKSAEREDARGRPDAEQDLARLALFWSPLGTIGPTDAFRGSGKYVAAAEWVRAMARHGSVPRLDIFAPLLDMERIRRQVGTVPAYVDGAQTAAASFIPESDIRSRFGDHGYDVLHRPADLGFVQASYLRSRFSRRLVPITCAQMGISYSEDLYPCWISLMTAQVYPCDAIVCSTEASRRAMANRLHDIAQRYCGAWGRPMPPAPRLELIPWGIDTQRFAPRDQASARRELDLPLDRVIFLWIGRMRIQDKMDCTPLLLAFEHVCRASRERPLLVLAGANSAEYGSELLALAAQLGIRKEVRTFFNLPPACEPALYAACDVFVSPVDSPSESFGLTVVEAMACGRPVVASDWNGYRELIAHGETGFKVRTDWADCLGEVNLAAPAISWEQEHLHVGQSVSVDMAELEEYLLRLAQNRDLREEMGSRGRARAVALYDWPWVIAQWESMWRELSAVAQTIEMREPDRLDYLQPNYFKHFSHYASRIVGEHTPVRLSVRGRELLAGKGALFLHPWAHGFLRQEHLHGCLSALKPTGWMAESMPTGELLRVLGKVQGLSQDQALLHLMWLAKYGLVSFGEAELQPDEVAPA